MDYKQLALRRPISSRRSGSVGGEVVAAAMERSSLATASFRVYMYYGLRAGAVPFLWESTPGTPKTAAAAATASVAPAEMVAATDAAGAGGLPPISPPPSYHSSQLNKMGSRRCRARSPCPAGCGLSALLAALGVRRRSRRRPASQSQL
ncbi:unnamed protein product [Urochloa decumbens]|uniref:Uncharacterized protein n=1 Tax=Urochloa decumbens TaxID=240449 RepID=A0ABC8X2R9_9POAL